MLDIDAQLDGEVGGRFVVYSTAANLDLIRRRFRKTPFLSQVGEARMEALARHPDTTRCALTGSTPR